MASAEEIAKEYESGAADYEKDLPGGGSGKHRSKMEQVEHKKVDPAGDTRRMVQNMMSGEEKRKEDEKQKLEKKESKEPKK